MGEVVWVSLRGRAVDGFEVEVEGEGVGVGV